MSAPSAPVLTNLVGQPVDGGVIEVQGTGAAGDAVTLYADGGSTSVGAGVVGADGTFDIKTTATFADGAHSLTATQTDGDGQTSAASASLSAPVAPLTPVLTALVGQAASGWTIAVKGAAGKAGDTVTLYNAGVAIGSAVVAADGSFEIDTSQTLAIPTPTAGASATAALTVTQTDSAGIASAQSGVVNVNVGYQQVDLGPLAETVTGSGGTDKLFAQAGNLNPADRINLTGDTAATLGLQGPGVFDLSALAQLTGLTLVQLHATSPGQTTTLRDGLNVAVAVLGSDTGAATIHGANNSDAIDLLHGIDTVYLGSVNESVQGGTGADRVFATAATAGALVKGGSGGLTLEITGGGTAALNAGDRAVKVQLDQATTLTLAGAPTSVTGSSGDDTIAVTASGLRAALSLDGGGGSNTLALLGAGSFDLSRLGALANFAAINVTEGAGANAPTVRLRPGQTLTVNVQGSGGTAFATILGGADSDIIKLGSGQDLVTLGAATETVQGGAGQGVVTAKTAATAGALLTGGAGGLVLNVTAGGAVTLNAADSGVSVVNLLAGAAPYTVVTNNERGLTVNDQGRGLATVTLGGAGQTFTGGGAGRTTVAMSAAGGDTVTDSSVFISKDTIQGFASAGNLIDVTDISSTAVHATFTENAAGTSGVLGLTDGSHTAFITLMGAFAAAGSSGAASAAGFSTMSDGSAGVLVSWTAHH